MATAWLHLPADARTRCRMISETMSRRAKLMQQGVPDSHKLQPDLCACQLQMLQSTPSTSYPLDQDMSMPADDTEDDVVCWHVLARWV